MLKIHADQIICTKLNAMIFAYEGELTENAVYSASIMVLGERIDAVEVGIRIVERLAKHIYEAKITSWRFDDITAASKFEGRNIL